MFIWRKGSESGQEGIARAGLRVAIPPVIRVQS